MFGEACPACHDEVREGGSKAEGLNSPQDEFAVADMTVPFLRWVAVELIGARSLLRPAQSCIKGCPSK
jgi:hypothetical protein